MNAYQLKTITKLAAVKFGNSILALRESKFLKLS
jgi:hypothetical protein